jgi:hypothetical protein
VRSEHAVRSRTHKVFVESDPGERDPVERDQPPPTPAGKAGEGGGEQIAADAALIVRATGMDEAEAQATAALAAASGHGPGYVAELVAHVTASPSVTNPAGCLRALVQQGRRRPPRGAGGVPPRAQRPALHPEHYGPGGKYAHLFQRVVRDDPPPQSSVLSPGHSLGRGPSAFEVAANPHLAGRGAAARPRGQPDYSP